MFQIIHNQDEIKFMEKVRNEFQDYYADDKIENQTPLKKRDSSLLEASQKISTIPRFDPESLTGRAKAQCMPWRARSYSLGGRG